MADSGRKPHVNPSLASDGDNPAYAAMIARAAALVPQLRDRATRTEELRRLPPETERDLHDAGLFRIVQPKRVGGSEFDYVALVDCADVLGQGDASVAWNFANLASHHWMLGMFTGAPRTGLGRGPGRADRLGLYLSGGRGEAGAGRLYPVGPLGFLVGRRTRRNGT